ncbi:hypothetical protein QBC40DRAFT_262655 [Triangularia verruculosa]|uniref:Uncharacterized protein n=1 Tax=Triangularia verruculosa TaxID=2587418 RepID=A0AAN6XPE7_9PEZI|nr:hypothetical protein QBC40DRAFT_262655 [Triangularia verruculosa]
MPSSKAAKKKQRQKKAAEKNMVIPDMTKEEITSMVSKLESKHYEQVIVDAARKFDDVGDMVIAQHQSLLKIRAHEETLVLVFAKMAKAIGRSLSAKYWELVHSTAAEARSAQVQKYAKGLANDIDATLTYLTADITPDSLYGTKFAALNGIRSVLESILLSPKPLLNALSRQPAFKGWDVKLMVVMKHFGVNDMCKLKCGQYKCGEEETPTQWMKDMKRLCLLHEAAEKKVFSHWLDDAFNFRYSRVQEAKLPTPGPSQSQTSSSQTGTSSSLNSSAELSQALPSETDCSSEEPKTEAPRPKLNREEIQNMVSLLFPSVLKDIMISTLIAHSSVIPTMKIAHDAKAASEALVTNEWDQMVKNIQKELNVRYRVRKTNRRFSLKGYADYAATILEDTMRDIYRKFASLHAPLVSTKIAALESCRKIIENLLTCPDDLRDEICWHAGHDKTNVWGYNMVAIMRLFDDEEIYKLVKGETVEPNEFWSKRGLPALIELANKVVGPSCHPNRKEFFREGFWEVSALIHRAFLKYGDPTDLRDDRILGKISCTCGFCDDDDDEDYCSCDSLDGFDEDEGALFHGTLFGFLR